MGAMGIGRGSGIDYPFGIVVDHGGQIVIADTFNHRIRMAVQ
jgi:hypothetical protein